MLFNNESKEILKLRLACAKRDVEKAVQWAIENPETIVIAVGLTLTVVRGVNEIRNQNVKRDLMLAEIASKKAYANLMNK